MSFKKSEEIAFKVIIYNQCMSNSRCDFVVDEDQKICGWCQSMKHAFFNHDLGNIAILENFKLFTMYFNFDVVSKAIKIRR